MKKQGKNIVYGKAVRPNAGRESCIKKSQQKPVWWRRYLPAPLLALIV